MEDKYLSVKNDMLLELKVKRSIFIAHIKHVLSKKEVKSFLATIGNKHPDASHNCFAYRIGIGKEQVSHYSDAGEPPGSAGRPIMGAIQKNHTTNIIIIVTRYFGGKKLGIRGLIDTYSQIADEIINKAGIVKYTFMDLLEVSCDYSSLDNVFRAITQCRGKILSCGHKQQACIKVKIRHSQSQDLIAALTKYDCNITQVE